MNYTKKQRDEIIAESKGKVIERLEYVEDKKGGSYWVFHFTDGIEMSFRFMTEILSHGIK